MNLTEEMRNKLREVIEEYAKATGVRVINIDVTWPSRVGVLKDGLDPCCAGLHIVAECD